MHPAAFSEYQKIKARNPDDEMLAAMTRAKHFHVSNDLHKAAATIAKHEAISGDPKSLMDMPANSFLPASEVVLTIDCDDFKTQTIFLVGSSNILEVGVYSFYNGYIYHMGNYFPGKHFLRQGKPDLSPDDASFFLCRTAFIISLINEPRRVARRDVQPSRQVRRVMERMHGITGAAYTEVCWQIGKDVRAKVGGGDGTSRMPLHWCRSHLRVCEPTAPKAVWNEVKGGWYCRVADCWKGHPDFGVKLQIHVPRIAGETRQVGTAVPTQVSGERLALMNAAKASALMQAGYAA